MFYLLFVIPCVFACKKVDHGPNVFEETLPNFRLDPIGYGDRSFTGCTLLHKMIGQRDRAGILEKKYFLTKRALNGFSCKYDGWYRATPLWMAVSWRGDSWIELIKLMIQNGADVNAVPNYSTFSSTNRSILGEAAEGGSVETVAALLENGADPNGGNKKPLMAAGWKPRVARILLEHGADPTMMSNYTPHDRSTPLKLAIENGETEMVDLYKEFGF